MAEKTISRRRFLVSSAAVTGGLVIGTYFIARDPANPLTNTLEDGEAAMTAFVKISEDGITFIVPRADVGQGIASMQAYLIAEELDVDPHSVRLDTGQPHAAYANGVVAANGLPFFHYDKGFVPEATRSAMKTFAKLTAAQFTGGSSSTASMEKILREAGAVTRETLKQAAANLTGTPRSKLSTRDGSVVIPDGSTIPYTKLAREAAKLTPITSVSLKPPADWRFLGKPQQRTDIVAKSTGTQNYGIDVRLENMLHATVVRNPMVGGTARQFDAGAATTVRGVKKIVPVTGGVGVIADNTWRAFQAAAALEISWIPANKILSSDQMWDVLREADTPDNLNSQMQDEGDVESSLANRSDALEVEYKVPYLAHGALEPISCTVLYTKTHLDIWTATQVPDALKKFAAEKTGLAAEDITLHALPAGGSFGRRLDGEYLIPAIELAQAVPGIPVKTTLSREEDTIQDYPRPMALAKARGSVRAGHVECMDMDVISQSVIDSWFGRVFIVPPGPDTTLFWGAGDQPYKIPNYRVSAYRAPEMLPIGSWRSPGACSNIFFHEGFLDELIEKSGADPIEERLRLLHHSDSRRVVELVAEMANWKGTDIGPNRGRGVAFGYSHGVPAAEVIDVTVSDQGIRIDDVWVAIDCGTVLDPVNAEAQVMGSVIFGLAHAMNCERTYENGIPQQVNFDQFEGMRLHQSPRIHVGFSEQAEEIAGLGEPGLPPAAPALANAIYAATGTRLREMPFNKFVDFA
ncbi:MAG: xanthine dehydrogenase family protein molybdopterin-binding subunit [Kordiimonadaceae bacterium]|nr:xanthine dehydrogenase family protein molybdopterin-binding subunit [Kordiimonadaceae bacterium]MBO6569834.1 xanthine dehydrogenase family protein molybdopterin-binding subunit [Kordiimonadaceae bacterium]MBO6966070.1 xanthine dehydrogenase family protein molybdopterin-binding subunit [Kordiimonadaceae bacterium]